MGVYMLEVMLRLDKDKGLLNVDIQNMFNTLCRVALMEDVMDSKELLQCDFTSLAAWSGGSSNAVTIAAEDAEARRRDSGG